MEYEADELLGQVMESGMVDIVLMG